MQQPLNGSFIQNGQQPVNGTGQQVYQQPQVQPQSNNNQPYIRQTEMDEMPELEPQFAMTNDPSAHREGEYEQYPDFPGYQENGMLNYQNV